MKTAPDRARVEGHERIKHRARRQFDRWAETYDRSLLNELAFFPTMRACQEEIIRWRRRGGEESYRLLDVGCGTASLLALLSADPAARELVGVDFSREMAARATEKLKGYGPPERLRVVHGDAEHLPLADASYDLITCCHSFHHYPHQPAVMREFHRVLRPGGALILIDGFRDNVIGWAIFDVVVASIERHVHHAAWSEIRAMAAEAGFGQIEQRKLNVLAPLLVNVATR